MRARAPDFDPRCSLARARRLPHTLVLDGEGATSLSAALSIKGCVEPALYLFHDLALSSAGRKHDASNLDLQSTMRYVRSIVSGCTRFGRAGLVRRIRRTPCSPSTLDSSRDWGARVTHASKPLRVAWLRMREKPMRAATRSPSFPESLPERRPIHSTTGHSLHLSTKRDSRRERREPSRRPRSFGPRGRLRGACRSVILDRWNFS